MLQTAPSVRQIALELISPIGGAGMLIGVAAAGFLWLQIYRTYDEGYKEYDTLGVDRSYEGRIDPPSESQDSFWAWALAFKYKRKSDRHEGSTMYDSKAVPTGVGLLLQSLLFLGVFAIGRYYQIRNPSMYPDWSVIVAQAVGGFAVALTITNVGLILAGLLYRATTGVFGSLLGAVRTAGNWLITAFGSNSRGVETAVSASGQTGTPEGGSPTDNSPHVQETATTRSEPPTAERSEDTTDTSGNNQPRTEANNGGESAGFGSESIDGVATELDAELDDFDREEKIGSGGNADVYRATYQGNDTIHTVALKMPRMTDGQTVDVSLLENFSREAKTWAALDDHEAIVTVFDWGTTPQPWIALEFMQGNLRSRLPLTLETGIDVLCEVADALQHAHRHGVAHRDLKPENVLFATDLPDSVRVGDWGLAKVLLDHSHSTTGMTPTYAAPEQFTDTPTTAKEHQMTDIYQLGAIGYEVFTGQPPFQGDTFEVMEQIKNNDPTPVSEIDASLPDELDDILLCALRKDPADRFDTAVHFRERLQSL